MQGTMEILDAGTGDTKVMWNSDNEDEVSAARAQFDTLTKKGYAAFRVEKSGSKGERVRTFDPKNEALILVPQIRGG